MLIPALIGLLGVVLLLLAASRYGLAVNDDSVSYLSAARHLLDGEGYVHYDGEPYVHWPPLYPAVLAGVTYLTGMSLPAAALLLNALLYGLIIFTAGRWLYRHASVPFALLGTATILLSAPLFGVSLFMWSETLFILLLLLALIQLGRYLSETGGKRALILSALLTALALLSRYMGVTLLLTGSFCLLFLGASRGIKRRAQDVLLFFVISFLPVGLWLMRNYFLTGTLMGERGASSMSAERILYFMLAIPSAWILPPLLSFGSRILVLSVSLLFVLFILRGGLKSRRICIKGFEAVLPMRLFAGIYLSWLFFSAMNVAFDRINTRLLSPVHVPVILIAALVLERIANSYGAENSRVRRRVRLGVMAGWGLWLIYPALVIGLAVQAAALYGAGVYSTEPWRTSPTIEYLNTRSIEGEIQSNFPAAVYFFTDRETQTSPRRYLCNSPLTPKEDLFILARRLEQGEGPIMLVWFNEPAGDFIHSLDEVGSCFRLERIREFTDGKLFWISPLEGHKSD